MIEYMIARSTALAARCQAHALTCKATTEAGTALVWHALIKVILG